MQASDTLDARPRANNALLNPWPGSGHLPPFDAIGPEDFRPALDAAMVLHLAELDAIASNPAAPDFLNTVVAFDQAGQTLARVERVFDNLAASHTSAALQAVQREVAPLRAAHESAVYMHRALFARLDALHAQRLGLGLDAASLRLLERIHVDFVRAGAMLGDADQTRYAQIVEQLARLTTQFGQNVLADENAWHLSLQGPQDFAGLPDGLLAATREAATQRGIDGHVVPLTRSMVVPFLTFSERRDLRETVWRAYTQRGANDGAADNRPIVREILALRAQQARLLGHASYAHHSLSDKMAAEPAAVWRLLDDVWSRALVTCEREREQIEALKAQSGDTHALQAWDWRYWSERVRQRRFSIDDAEVKPYFTLERMTQAAFDCAQRLFGVSFELRPDLKAYHPDVNVYAVHATPHPSKGAAPMGLFLHDNYARPSKRSGAWMSSLRWQSHARRHTPVILNNNNFNKPPPGEPTLLSFDDVRTLFHEFGHALHGLLSNVPYDRLSGTQVLRDFVELPSQLFEHWALEPEVLRRHALHVNTGQPIPDALIERLREARRYGQGYDTLRYTASAIADLAVHELPVGQTPGDPVAFEEMVFKKRGLPEAVGANHRFTHFQHLFSGDGYAAGYYVYLWAEVLDADAFEAFVEAGDAFDAQVAAKLKQHVFAAGDTVNPAITYRAFRGRDARVEPMLADRGLIDESTHLQNERR